MSSTQMSNDTAEAPLATGVPLRLEVVVLPVSDVDRAKAFYVGLGWRLDADIGGGDYRVVQVTPPASGTSVIFGTGITAGQPGSFDGLLLAVDDIDAAREELVSRGADVSEVFHGADGNLGAGFHIGNEGRAPGHDPEGRSYATHASFTDPDGNRWVLQEIVDRLPGRVWSQVGSRAELLHETAEHHDRYEHAAPPHDWWDWYAAYFDARERGSNSHEADEAADRYMAEVKGVAVSS
jgi:catechol 2,3-dioxygenase-like lactoylglutathione lyase family enzyme